MDDINTVDLSFRALKRLDVEKSRELLVACIEELVGYINSDQEVRAYLNHYPFTAEDIRLSISFYDDLIVCFFNRMF